MQKLNEKKILGTVPKKLQLVETFWDCPEFSRNKQNQKGITLIALIITIIVMLILVGVTTNVALNGGLFTKAEEATTKTKIAQIQEALTIKKAEILAEHDGVVEEYDLAIDNLSIPTELEKEYESKLIIGKDGILYYNSETVIDVAEQKNFKAMGIKEYEQVKSSVEYYPFVMVSSEAIYVIDYDNKIMKFYTGDMGQNLILAATMDFEFEKSTTPFNIIENGETVDIGTGAIKLTYDNNTTNAYVINEKVYFAPIEGQENSGIKQDSDFDVTRLVEE